MLFKINKIRIILDKYQQQPFFYFACLARFFSVVEFKVILLVGSICYIMIHGCFLMLDGAIFCYYHLSYLTYYIDYCRALGAFLATTIDGAFITEPVSY